MVFILPHFLIFARFKNYLNPANPPLHPVRDFGETAQFNKCSQFIWVDKKGKFGEIAACTLKVHNKIIAHAEADSAKVARRLTAKQALKLLRENPNFWKENCSCTKN